MLGTVYHGRLCMRPFRPMFDRIIFVHCGSILMMSGPIRNQYGDRIIDYIFGLNTFGVAVYFNC